MRNCLSRNVYCLLMVVSTCLFASSSFGQEVSIGKNVESVAPAVGLCDLLHFKDVRESLNLDEKCFRHLELALAPIREAAPKYEDFLASDFDGRMQATDRMCEKALSIDDSIWALLTECLPPDAMQKLMGAHIQWKGVESLFNRRICQTLGIGDDQLNTMRVAVDGERRQRRTMLSNIARGKAGQEIRSSLILRDERLAAKAMESLNQSQRKRLETMLEAGLTITPHVHKYTFGW